jgi:hypothetical protein
MVLLLQVLLQPSLVSGESGAHLGVFSVLDRERPRKVALGDVCGKLVLPQIVCACSLALPGRGAACGEDRSDPGAMLCERCIVRACRLALPGRAAAGGEDSSDPAAVVLECCSGCAGRLALLGRPAAGGEDGSDLEATVLER